MPSFFIPQNQTKPLMKDNVIEGSTNEPYLLFWFIRNLPKTVKYSHPYPRAHRTSANPLHETPTHQFKMHHVSICQQPARRPDTIGRHAVRRAISIAAPNGREQRTPRPSDHVTWVRSPPYRGPLTCGQTPTVEFGPDKNKKKRPPTFTLSPSPNRPIHNRLLDPILTERSPGPIKMPPSF